MSIPVNIFFAKIFYIIRDKRHYEQFADGTVKDIEDEIPFDVPEGWAWCRLGEICSKLVDGDHNPPKGINEKTEYLMISSRNINHNQVEDLEYVRYLTKDIFDTENKRTNLQVGDILFTSVGSLGRSCVYAGGLNLCFQRSVTIIHTNQYNFWLKYYFDSDYYQAYILDNATGTAQLGFYLQQMEKSFIPLPPLAEQERIVSVIKSIFSQIDTLDQNKSDLQTAIKQTKSKILDLAIHGKLVPQDTNDEPAEELLKRIATSDNRPYKKFEYEGPYEIPSNWSWCYLSDVCSKIKRGKSPKYIDKSTIMAFAQKCNKKDGPTSLEKALYIDESTLKKYSEEEKMQFNDIVINSTGTGTLGRVGIFNCKIPSDVVAVYPDSHITTVRIIPELNKIYFYYFIKIRQNYLESMGEGSTNQKELKTETINNIAVPLPPLAEQQRIVSKIEELFKQLDIIQNEIGV